MLIVQVVITQWDKSQLSVQHQQMRHAIPMQYELDRSRMIMLDSEHIGIAQHGDDVLGNRLQYQLIDDDVLLIDRFRISLASRTLEYKSTLSADTLPETLTTMKNNWVQCHYSWRYRVDEGGFIYWLYEDVTLNVAMTDSWNSKLFVETVCDEIFEL